MAKYDFSGWATKNDMLCSDGRTIRRDAFKHNDGQKVPLVWNHQHKDATNVLGHALLENREEGVYAYCTFNETESGQNAKMLVQHGDITALSIYANKLKQMAGDVLHGAICEVSLVLAGANPGAFIDSVLAHGDGSDEEAIIYTGETIELYHSDEDLEDIPEEKTPEKSNEELQHSSEEEPKKEGEKKPEGGKTVKEVFNTLNEDQKKVVYALIGEAKDSKGEEEPKDESEKGEKEMKHNLFENEQGSETVLTHADQATIIADAKKYGSVKESFMAHAAEYGIENIDYLFPDAKTLNNTPEFIKREMDWVGVVMSGTHHSPFSRVKSIFANITEDEARAKGYIKGKLKKEEVFSLLKRSTDPQTIYKKQKLDRDDVIDITDFDVVAWLKGEMRMMLDEEIARAILIGDGRLVSDDDHISADHIRPIASDAELYTIQKAVTAGANDDETAKNFIRTAIKARKEYKGSGNPVLFTTEDMLTDMLLLEDGIGHALYANEAALATKLRVSKIVTVPVMEGAKGKNGGDLLGIIVNLSDYNVGADKGGAVAMFDDFDIDYNQMKYLIETRCSGALIKPFSAIALEKATA